MVGRSLLAGALPLLLFGAACTNGSDSRSTSPTVPASGTTTAPVEVAGATPEPTLRAAVEALLTAEQQGDHAGSYKLLDAAGHTAYEDVADWTERRSGLAPVTGFRIDDEATTAAVVVAVVRHEPGLDPFIGLSPAEERQTWRGTRTAKGYLVDPDPTVVFVTPSEATIATTVHAWAVAVQACDQAAAARYQAVDDLYGEEESDGAQQLCRSTGPLTVGRVGRLAAGPGSAALVAQYTSDVLTWARTVPVTGAASFTVVVAPIGAGWKVLGFAA